MKYKIGVYEIGLAIIGIILVGLLLNTLFLPLLSTDSDRTNDNVKVGVIDSGCSETQNFVAEYQSFIKEIYGYSTDQNSGYDQNGHGTKVCDIIHQIAPETTLFSARIEYFGELTFEGILEAIHWLADDIQVDIINLSLGSIPYLTSGLFDIFQLYEDEVIFIAATGNRASVNNPKSGYGDWPAILPNVIGVGGLSDLELLARSSMSSFGQTYQGFYITEFSELVSYGSATGTSFSAPRISGHIANIISYLTMDQIDFQISDVIYLAIKNSQQMFKSEIGWGFPNLDNLSFNEQSTDLVIESDEQIDKIVRFVSEEWKIKYKIIHYKMNESTFNSINWDFSGNGSDAVKSVESKYYSWGGILEIELENPFNESLRRISISSNYNEPIDYLFQTTSNYSKRILIDSRNTINGLINPYAQYSNFDTVMRESGYLTSYSYFSENINLGSYDLVLLPNFAQIDKIANLEISADGIMDRVSEYVNYVENGGKIGIFMNRDHKTDNSTASELLNYFNTTIGEFGIGEQADLFSTCCAQIIDDFGENQFSSGLTRLDYIGVQLINSTETNIIGWYPHHIVNQVTNIWVNRAIGIGGFLGSGSYVIFGSSSFFTNEFFTDKSSNSVINLINNLSAAS